ncbi:MAG: hypothetical protein ACK4NC_05875 [Candidatus Gracilibacteria bacterium]
MSSIFFKVNETFDQELKTFMQDEGYDSKAEFFRFLIKFYKYHRNSELLKLNALSQELSDILIQLDKKGKIPTSLKAQLADV